MSQKNFEQIAHEEMNSIRQFLPDGKSESICYQAMINMMKLVRRVTLQEVSETAECDFATHDPATAKMLGDLINSGDLEISVSRSQILNLPPDSLPEHLLIT
jgi:hypothetical protein